MIEAEKRIGFLLKEYGLYVKKIKENNKNKTPDFIVREDKKERFYCEVKNIKNKNVDFYFGKDPVFNRLTTHIHQATKQLIAQDKKLSNVIAFYVVTWDRVNTLAFRRTLQYAILWILGVKLSVEKWNTEKDRIAYMI